MIKPPLLAERLCEDFADRAMEFILHPERFVDVKLATHQLRVHPATIRWLARRKDLESVKTGKTIWIYQPSIPAYLERVNSLSH